MDYAGFWHMLRKKAGGHAGMILIHNGVVRNRSRDGRPVEAIDVRVDWSRLHDILDEARKRPGIVSVEAEVREGTLRVGEDIMLLGIAGDVRENVIRVLSDTLERIKREVTAKREVFIDEHV